MNGTLKYFLAGLLAALVCEQALALPSFTRQTGQSCASCHLNAGELTPAGRKFKLLGYAGGNSVLPFSATAVASVTKIRDTASSADANVSLPKNGSPILESASVYAAGKYWGDLGGYLKLTFNGANTSPLFGSQGVQTGSRVGSDVFLDASEIRYVRRTTLGDHDLILGVTANNAPAMQDLWVTTPVNTYPYRTSGLLNAWGIGQFGPTTLIDGGLASQVGGIGFYAMLDDGFYAEFTNYSNMHSGLAGLQLSGPVNTINSGYNPYWRLAWNRVAGADSLMLGTFGMITTLARDQLVPGSASGKYRDIGLDAEYQHITDLHSWSAQATLIDEKVDWGSRSVGRSHDLANSTLQTFKAKLTYDYARRYGASVFGFRSTGTTDNLYWAYNPDQSVVTGACNQNNSLLAYCSANGTPNTSGYGFEITYVPLPNVHLALQQTFYRNFLGGATFIDNSSGQPRAARDNNLTYLYLLLAY
jgi:hypothetical protein